MQLARFWGKSWRVVAWVSSEVQRDEKPGMRRPWLCSRRRRRSRLCWGPSEVALRLLRWSYLSRWWLLASEAADHKAHILRGPRRLRGTCQFEVDEVSELNIKYHKRSLKSLLMQIAMFEVSLIQIQAELVPRCRATFGGFWVFLGYIGEIESDSQTVWTCIYIYCIYIIYVRSMHYFARVSASSFSSPNLTWSTRHSLRAFYPFSLAQLVWYRLLKKNN